MVAGLLVAPLGELALGLGDFRAGSGARIPKLVEGRPAVEARESVASRASACVDSPGHADEANVVPDATPASFAQ